jgi:hypothetical protein
MKPTFYMQFVYPIPVWIGGYFVMTWALEQSEKNIGINGEKLRSRRDLDHSNTEKQNGLLKAVLKKAQGADSKD